MKNKNMRHIFFIFLIACVVFSGILYGCAARGKYFTELKASYYYDKNNEILIKFPSELVFESNELLTYENKKTSAVNYGTVDLVLPKRDYYTGAVYDYKLTVGYAVHNGKIVFTEIPIQYAPGTTYAIGGGTDSFIVAAGNENAFFVNLDGSGNPQAKKIFDDGDIDDYFDKDAIVKLIYAKIISVSPDGKYILYISNRDYAKGDSPGSLDIYYYDMENGAETKIMNFDAKEFLCWEEGAPGSFLFRKTGVDSSTGKKVYSDILRYSLAESKEDVFFPIEEKYASYEIIDDRHIYTMEKNEQTYTIYITDIYTGETTAVSAGKYSVLWSVKLSESGEYLAFFGSYLNIEGKAIPEAVTLHIETNDIVAHYEQNEGVYFVDSLFWCPGNVLIINFQNTVNLYRDLCRFHEIKHKK